MMDPSIKNLPPGDPKLIENIVSQLKSQGIFDEFRRDCLADVDTKPAYQNLQHRVENFASEFLKSTQWRPDLNKNQLRDGLRRHINESGMLTTGVDRIIDQIVNPKIIQIFFPKITEIVRKIFGIDTSSPSQGSPSDDVVSESEQAAAFPKPMTVPTENSNDPTENKTVSVKPEPPAAVPDVPHVTTDKPESSPYIDAIEEQLLVLTGAHEYMKLEQHQGSPVSDPASKASGTTSRERIPNAERDGENKRDKSKEDSNRKPDCIAKPAKKADPKTAPKGKSSTSDKPKLSSSEKKPEKPAKREHSPSKSASGVKATDSKSVKPDDKKGSTKPSSEKPKVRNDLPRHDDGSQKAKKPPDSKEGADSSAKTHKPLAKSKSFEEKDGGKAKHEKSAKVDKARDESERPKGSQSADKPDKSKDSGKPRVSEGDKSSKHRSDKSKPADKKPESGGSKHRSSQPDKSRHHQDDKSKSIDKMLSSGSGHAKSKDADKGKPKSTKVPAFGDKLSEADKSYSASKPKTASKSVPPDRDDKARSKKEPGKAKPEQKGKAGALPNARPDKAPAKKAVPEGSSAANKAETAVKDGSASNKVLKRQFSGSPDTSAAPKKPKQDDKPKSETKPTKSVQPSPPKSQSSSSDSYSSSDDEDFEEFEATDVVSPTKIREDILKKGGANGDDGLSDVTVSSVHTSDLSDFDDRITLSESEEERAQSTSPRKKSRSTPSSQEEPKVVQPPEQVTRIPAVVVEKLDETKGTKGCKEGVTQKVHDLASNAKVHDKREREVEPRRELRRQRKLNPRYTSDDFSSIFNTGKDKQNHGHIFEHVAEDLHREMPEVPSRGRRSTGHSTTTDDTEFPGSPISDVSELGEQLKAKRGRRSKLCSPSESSDGDHSGKGPRSISSEANEGEDFRPRTSSQQSGSGRKRKQESPVCITGAVEPVVSPRSDSNGRRNSKAENANESPAISKRATARYDNQRYSNTDLYKPRPVFTSSRRRAASPNKPTPSYSDFGPLVIDESAGQDGHERTNKKYVESQSSSQGKRRQPEKKPSSASKRRR